MGRPQDSTTRTLMARGVRRHVNGALRTALRTMHCWMWTSFSAGARPVAWSGPRHQVNTLYLVSFQRDRTSDVSRLFQGLLNTRRSGGRTVGAVSPGVCGHLFHYLYLLLPLSTWEVHMSCWGVSGPQHGLLPWRAPSFSPSERRMRTCSYFCCILSHTLT